LAAILDGTSNTFMFGEIGQSANARPSVINNGVYPVWIGGNNDANCVRYGGGHLRLADATPHLNRKFNLTGSNPNPDLSDYSFGSYHPGGAQFTLGDASVRFVPNTVNVIVYRAMGGRNDGTPVQMP
jgi:hypothetical protein